MHVNIKKKKNSLQNMSMCKVLKKVVEIKETWNIIVYCIESMIVMQQWVRSKLVHEEDVIKRNGYWLLLAHNVLCLSWRNIKKYNRYLKINSIGTTTHSKYQLIDIFSFWFADEFVDTMEEIYVLSNSDCGIDKPRMWSWKVNGTTR